MTNPDLDESAKTEPGETVKTLPLIVTINQALYESFQHAQSEEERTQLILASMDLEEFERRTKYNAQRIKTERQLKKMPTDIDTIINAMGRRNDGVRSEIGHILSSSLSKRAIEHILLKTGQLSEGQTLDEIKKDSNWQQIWGSQRGFNNSFGGKNGLYFGISEEFTLPNKPFTYRVVLHPNTHAVENIIETPSSPSLFKIPTE